MSTATTPAPQDFLTYEEAADYLGITVSALRQAISGEKLRPHKFPHNSRKYLTRQQLDDYRAGKHRRTVTPSSSASSPAALDNAASAAAAEAYAHGASRPLLEGWRELLDGWRETRKGLTAVAIASVFQAQGIEIDPKRLAG